VFLCAIKRSIEGGRAKEAGISGRRRAVVQGRGGRWRLGVELVGGARVAVGERGEKKMGRWRKMGQTERGWAAGEGNGPSEVGRRPGAVFGLGKKRRASWAGLETGKGERERLRVLFVFFQLLF
jgi:hypothetical protein